MLVIFGNASVLRTEQTGPVDSSRGNPVEKIGYPFHQTVEKQSWKRGMGNKK